ncbi:hypothetical protein RGU11_02860 [Rossellomorea marisflavi]|uniref:hypothetical protein n=1 Tax=Rossellomorea marisflavi TaxID=189381 RepID=UPI0028533D48|nr:hypothetical protein [Rossellomorea marisflavi]MDR4935320.1 hypothetical protein [Rossellomorea marisflavi]
MNREEALERLEEVEYLLKEVEHCEAIIRKRRRMTGILFLLLWTIGVLSLFYFVLLPVLDMLWTSLHARFFHTMDIALSSYPFITFTIVIIPTIYNGLKISRANEAAVLSAQETINTHFSQAADLVPLPPELQYSDEITVLKDFLYLEQADTIEEAINMRISALPPPSEEEKEITVPTLIGQSAPLPVRQKNE